MPENSGGELADLQLDHDVAQQLNVEEEEVDEELVAADHERKLATYEGELLAAGRGHELLDVFQEGELEVFLVRDLLAGDEREVQRVGKELSGKI